MGSSAGILSFIRFCRKGQVKSPLCFILSFIYSKNQGSLDNYVFCSVVFPFTTVCQALTVVSSVQTYFSVLILSKTFQYVVNITLTSHSMWPSWCSM